MTLADAHKQHQRLLLEVQAARLELATRRDQLTQQLQTLRAYVPALDSLAQRALDSEVEEPARVAIHRRRAAAEQAEAIEQQLVAMDEEERKLAFAETQLRVRLGELDVSAAQSTAPPAEEPPAATPIPPGVAAPLGRSDSVGERGEGERRTLRAASAPEQKAVPPRKDTVGQLGERSEDRSAEPAPRASETPASTVDASNIATALRAGTAASWPSPSDTGDETPALSRRRAVWAVLAALVLATLLAAGFVLAQWGSRDGESQPPVAVGGFARARTPTSVLPAVGIPTSTGEVGSGPSPAATTDAAYFSTATDVPAPASPQATVVTPPTPASTPTLAPTNSPTPVPTATRTPVPTATPTPIPPTNTPTPKPTDTPAPPRLRTTGIGLARSDWEQAHGRPGDEVGGFLKYENGAYVVGFADGKVRHITRTWGPGNAV